MSTPEVEIAARATVASLRAARDRAEAGLRELVEQLEGAPSGFSLSAETVIEVIATARAAGRLAGIIEAHEKALSTLFKSKAAPDA